MPEITSLQTVVYSGTLTQVALLADGRIITRHWSLVEGDWSEWRDITGNLSHLTLGEHG